MATTPHELAYDVAVEGLARQSKRLTDLRTRAATVLAAASIATSFLGAAAIKDKPPADGGGGTGPALTGWELVGVGGFCLLAAFVIAILAPWKWKGWHTSAIKLVRDYADDEEPADLDAIHRDLAIHYERRHRQNRRKLEALYWCFRVCCLLLAVQVVAWIIDLGVQ